MDKRRRQYVPIAVTMPHGNTGKRLKESFGRDGVLVWMLYLVACKTNWIQGQFTYTSEPDGWSKLGIYGDQPAFTLDEFFARTGRLHLTKKRRSGDVTDVVCRGWNEWNTEWKRESDANEKSRKRAQNTATLGATEVEVDSDDESEPDVEARSAPPAVAGGRPHLTAVRVPWVKPSEDEVQRVREMIPPSLRKGA